MLYIGFAGGVPCTSAQSVEMTYTTELQCSEKKEFNFVNLLRLDASFPIKSGSFDVASIHIYKSNAKRIADDWQTFSNIEEDNLAGSLVLLGYTQSFRNMSLFTGVRNVNDDFFTSPITSVFTNSSCGIFPTLSANYPLANYPLSAVCLDYKLSVKNWKLETALYNGVAHSGFRKGDHVFMTHPGKDGMFSISSLNYQTNDGNYFSGVALHNRLYHTDGEGKQTPEPQKENSPEKKMNFTWWGYVEQTVVRHGNRHMDVLAQYSENISVTEGCKRYAGLGLLLSDYLWKSQIGLFISHAHFSMGTETAIEVTWKVKLNKHLVVQPALHYIKNGNGIYMVSMTRMILTL